MKYFLLFALLASSVSIHAAVLDSDKDGVSDLEDNCKNTPTGKSVNEYGCMKDEKISMRLDVLFPFDQTTLNAEANPHLNLVAAFMKEHPESKLVVQGYTDNVGTPKENQKISMERADAVKSYLTKKEGIASSRIKVKAFGQTSPLASNSTAAGRAENRRVIGIVTL